MRAWLYRFRREVLAGLVIATFALGPFIVLGFYLAELVAQDWAHILGDFLGRMERAREAAQ